MLLHNGEVDDLDPIPDQFCWTRFGIEAGEPVARILERKEAERRANAGVFLWGVGNSVAPGIRELVRQLPQPQVLFSPIAGTPQAADAAPTSVVSWTEGETLWGELYTLPEHSRVTSRLPAPSAKPAHYALICYRPNPLAISSSGPVVAFDSLRNLVSGQRVGASQVTAVVRREVGEVVSGRRYHVALRASLVYPYFVRLTQAVPVEAVLELTSVADATSREASPVSAD